MATAALRIRAGLIAATSMLLLACSGGNRPPSYELPPSGTDRPPIVTPPREVAVTPSSVRAGSGDTELVVTGTDFANGHIFTSRVVWSTATGLIPLPSTPVSTTEVRATAPAELLQRPVVASIFVERYDRIEGTSSGRSPSVTFEVTAPSIVSSAEFRPTGDMSVARSWHSAVRLRDGRVFLVGGSLRADLFDPVDAVFVPTGALVSENPGDRATLLADGRVLVTGGSDGAGNPTAEIFDPRSETFVRTGDPVDRPSGTVTLLADGRVLVAGGMGAGSGLREASSRAQLFNPATGRFAITGSMLSARANHTATLLEDGRVLIVGGWNGHAPDAPDDPPWDPLIAELFNPRSGLFQAAASSSTTRAGPSMAVRLPDGNVAVVGGVTDPQNIHNLPTTPKYAEIYDVAGQLFTPMTCPRVGEAGSMTLLGNGLLLFVGGISHDELVRSATLLEPATGRSSTAGTLGTPRWRHTATLLDDGRVLVAGGEDSSGNPLVTAEIWQVEEWTSVP